jgi:anti-anti-sigma factor
MDKKKAVVVHRRRREIASDAISVGRSLDAESAKRFARSITKLIDNGVRECIIDLSLTEAVDSSGFGSLVAAVRKVGDVGGTVAIVCKDATVRRLFEVAGITRLVPVLPRMEDARIFMTALPRTALAS